MKSVDPNSLIVPEETAAILHCDLRIHSLTHSLTRTQRHTSSYHWHLLTHSMSNFPFMFLSSVTFHSSSSLQYCNISVHTRTWACTHSHLSITHTHPFPHTFMKIHGNPGLYYLWAGLYCDPLLMLAADWRTVRGYRSWAVLCPGPPSGFSLWHSNI